jgi:spore coat assembly protein
MKVGDLVSRKKYNNDIIFRITKISGNIAYLQGEDVRLSADAPIDDLVIVTYKETSDNIIEELIASRNTDESMIKGRVLHIDGDSRYLDKSLKIYAKNDVPVIGYYLDEKEMASQITNLLVKHKPDILVITGHDSYRNYNNEEQYLNSENFINAVKNARIYQPDKDALVIFAGACQSYYEGLIASGANFASSPKRLNIHLLDPVYIAIQVANTHVGEYVLVDKVLKNTTSHGKGLGGIDTRGVARRLYMGV